MADTADQKKKSDHRRRIRVPRPPAWWPLPAAALLGLVAGGAYGVLKAPEYAATSYVVAVPNETTEPATALGFAQAYARIATSSSTLAYAQPRAGIGARQLRTQVRAETSPDSPMIAITGTSKSPSEAADIANAVADALSLSSNQAAKNTGVQLILFNQAVAPADPASPPHPSAAPSACAPAVCSAGCGCWPDPRGGGAGRPPSRRSGTGASWRSTPRCPHRASPPRPRRRSPCDDCGLHRGPVGDAVPRPPAVRRAGGGMEPAPARLPHRHPLPEPRLAALLVALVRP
ncbi:YveK family protein [Streptomyces cirratus]|uniref:YveK family protein n=1 Tax=Streptomyces cirratus TaxID=68187 RepID=UPI00361B350A